MSIVKVLKTQLLIASISIIASCADWNSTPVTVDEHHGMAVRHMIANQTLYPENGQKERQELIVDGAKSEGVVPAYRAPASDLRKSKRGIRFGVGSGAITD